MTESTDRNRPPTHAGGIVVSGGDARPRYLLIRARSDQEHWVFPKGHIEAGESAEAAALREVEEEAGVRAEILRPLDLLSFEHAGEQVRVRYYLMRHVADGDAAEDRQLRWCDYETAMGLLSFEDSRRLLQRAVGQEGAT